MKSKIYFIGLLSVFVFSACKKNPGEGGTSAIQGKIWVQDYNQTFTSLWAEYDGADRDVYIIYGDNPSYNDRVRTGPDGTFIFTNLTKGNYTIYTYSKDSSLQSQSGQIDISVDVEITEKKQVVEIPTITVFE